MPTTEQGAQRFRLVCFGGDPAAHADLCERLREDLPEVDVLPDAERDWQTAEFALWHGEIGPSGQLKELLDAGMPVVAVGVPGPSSDAIRRRRAWRLLSQRLPLVLAESEEAARELRRISAPGLRVEAAGKLVPVPPPPPCNDGDREYFAQSLHARPIWLALGPSEDELAAIIAAHRAVLRGAHRLMLIVLPRVESGGPVLAERLRREGWQVALYSAGEEPEGPTEIFVADAAAELGLWLRLAPIAVLGGSFAPDEGGMADPLAPAQLGSAIVAGPAGQPHAELLARLERAGGAQRLAGSDELAAAVSDLLAPDRPAAMAQAAWEVISDGAQVQDRVIVALSDVMRDLRRNVPDAGAGPSRR